MAYYKSKILATQKEPIYCLCLLKDNKIALGAYSILIIEKNFSKIIFSIKNKYNNPIYEIIQSKRGPIICSENNLIKVYSIFSNYYNLIFTINRNSERIYKLRELSNRNIAYTTKDNKILLFHSNFKNININYDLQNKKVINFIEMRNNKLILLCVKLKQNFTYFNQCPRRLCFFYLKTLEKANDNSDWEIKDKCKIITKRNISYFVTREIMKISTKNYLVIGIGSYLYIYHIDNNDNFILYNNITFNGNEFIQCLCPYSKNILAIGSWSGTIFFLENNKLLKIKYIKNTKDENHKIRNLIKVDEGNIICIKSKDEEEEEVSLINNLNMKLIKHKYSYLNKN